MSESWMNAAQGALAELTRTAVALPIVEPLSWHSDAPQHVVGAFIPIIASDPIAQVQIGLLTDQVGCQELSRAFLGIKGAVGERDIVDAIGELANMLSGSIKRRMGAVYGNMSLGLPLFVRGVVDVPGHHLDWLCGRALVGPVAVTIAMLVPRA